MLAADIPVRFQKAFAKNAGPSYIRTVPVDSQIGVTPGAASQTDGFPPLNFTPVASGGIPPFGQDMNGILNQTTAWAQWFSAGGPVAFDATFAAAIGGYPRGAIVAGATLGLFWLSTADSNANDPDAGGANWIPLSYSIQPAVLTGDTQTYTQAQVQSLIMRSNSGAAMIDTLPGTGPGVLKSGSKIIVQNNDATALLVVIPGAGTSILRTTGKIYLGPGQSASFISDGANYAPVGVPARCRLAASTSIFVATAGGGGADTNVGVTAATPLLTTQAAWDLLAQYFDLGGFTLTIKVADGTYTAGINASSTVIGNLAALDDGTAAKVVVEGNTATPANVLFSTTGNCFNLAQNTALHLKGITMVSSAASAIFCKGFCTIDNVRFGACAGVNGHISVTTGGLVIPTGNYAIVGAAPVHFNAVDGGRIQTQGAGVTITITGTPAFSTAFAQSSILGILTLASITFSGSATGQRYAAAYNAVIATSGGGANYFPGNSAGVTSNGGIYQ